MNYDLERKEIALPGVLQKSLLSQSCEAEDVVLQLKETKQLDQASLEKPDLETRTLIRCFARKAKDSKRLDVVQHLREITPAGTAGKSAFYSRTTDSSSSSDTVSRVRSRNHTVPMKTSFTFL